VFERASILVSCLATTVAGAAAPSSDAESLFELNIRPVLSGTCFKCHGGEKTNNNFRVDSRESLLRGGDRGPAIVPGAPDRSLLVQAIRREHPEIQMPPKEPLPETAVAAFVRWVAADAPWPARSDPAAFKAARHWAFEPLRRVEPPLRPNGWSDHPIDRFIFARLKERGLVPVRPADKRVLIRRLAFDLTGLPPTPEDVAAFMADRSPDAVPRLIDRLLASPHYGERWGRHWMDVVRYADTAGDNADYPVPEARLYRDYVIDAFNADKPYDQFVQEQLAGDILARLGPPGQYAERVIATGFIALSRRYLTAPFEQMHLTIEDTIDTLGQVFLGMTFRCARCHDHKYDPVTREDYYGLYGFFASTQYPYAGSEEFESKKFPRSGFVPLVAPAVAEPHLAAHRAQVAQLRARVKTMEADDPLAKQLVVLTNRIEAASNRVHSAAAPHALCEEETHELSELKRQQDEIKKLFREKLKPLRAELYRVEQPGAPTDLPCAYAVTEASPTNAWIHRAGNPDDRGPVIARRPPGFLDGDAAFELPPGASGRLELARWLTRPEHPLTARVMVNRIWQHHFGKGLVATPSNFGARGEAPTHPALLDFLARRFVEGGWSDKAMHRLILTSQTYQLASAHHAANGAVDPDNRFYWRADRRRLDAEAIRDALLALAGRLDRSRPGPHPFPNFEEWHWTQHKPFKAVYESDHRSVYLMTQRIVRHPYLALFDAPDANVSTDVRTVSTVPLQALYLMNHPFVQAQAERFARRLLAANVGRAPSPRGSGAPLEVQDNPATRDRIRLAYELAWSRPPTSKETRDAVAYLRRYAGELGRTDAPREQHEWETWASWCRVLLTANEFFYLD
jgi:hypothetical protein